jgi:hypothetical protein
MPSCSNCNHQLSSHANYCSSCGQRNISYQKPIKPVLTDMFHETLDIDGRMFSSFKTLLSKPGLLSIEYNNGKRAKYTPPLRMYLVISILFFLVLSVIEQNINSTDGFVSSYSDSYSKIMFSLLPVFALFLQLLYRDTYYLSNLIIAIHLHCISYLVFMVSFPLEAYENNHPILVVLQLPLAIYLISYFLITLKTNYCKSWLETSIKFVILLTIYTSTLGLFFDVIFQEISD